MRQSRRGGGWVVIVIAGTASLATSAHAQTTFNWKMPTSGAWGTPSNWMPTGVPALTDTAVLGGAGAYDVMSSGYGEVATLNLASPGARLLVEGGFRLGSAFGPGQLVILGSQSTGTTNVSIEDGSVLNTRVTLAAQDSLGFARLGRTSSGPVPTIGASGVLTGTGIVVGPFLNEGLITGDGVGGLLQIEGITQGPGGIVRAAANSTVRFNATPFSGGTIVVQPGGVTEATGATFENLTIQGVFEVGVSGALYLNSGVTGGGFRLSGSSTLGQSALLLNDGATLTTNVTLAADGMPGGSRLGRSGGGATPAIGAGAIVSGTGIVDGPIINRGLLTGDGAGGLLELRTISQQAGGMIRLAPASTVRFLPSEFSGGVIQTQPGGMAEAYQPTFRNLTLQGTFPVPPGSSLVVDSGVTGDGFLVFGSPKTNVAAIYLADGVTLGANITLAAQGAATYAQMLRVGGGATPNIGAGSIISGSGAVTGPFINAGLITSDGAGGTLQLSTINQSPSGVIRLAPASTIRFVNSEFSGGTIHTQPGGLAETFQPTFRDLVLQGTFPVSAGGTAVVDNGVTGDGFLVSGSATTNGASLYLADGAALSTNVTLAADGGVSYAQLARIGSGATPTIGAGAVVTGSGTVTGPFVNSGLITSDGAGGTLQVSAIAQTPGGVIRLAPSSSVRFGNSEFSGGAIHTQPGGLAEPVAAAFRDLVLQGVFPIPPGGSVVVNDGVTGDGFRVSGSSTTNSAFLYMADGATLSTDVTLDAEGGPFYAQLTRIGSGQDPTLGADATVAGSGFIGGPFLLRGILRPGDATGEPIGQLTLHTVTFDPASRLRLDVRGAAPDQHDRLTSVNTISLAGTLEVSFIGGYIPGPGQQLTIIEGTGITGQFQSVQIPAAPAGVRTTVCYEPTAVRLTFGCIADVSSGAIPGQTGYGCPNGVINNDDFFFYLSQFAAGNLAVADLTTSAIPGSAGYGVPNGVINNDDFFFYLTRFAAGC